MVKGLNIFREHFKGFEDRYVLIGGTASSIIMEEAGGAEFRATKDLDIVLCIEALDSAFVQKFWDFIENGGGYSNKQKKFREKALLQVSFSSRQELSNNARTIF